MLEVLVASRPRAQARPLALLGSSILHATALALCVIGTRTTVKIVSRVVDDTTLIFLPRLGPPAVTQPPRHAGRPGGGGSGTGEGLSVVVPANPPPRGFQVVDVVSSVPTDLPPVDPGQRFLDPRDFTGRGVEGGVGWGVAGGTGPADQPMPEEGVGEVLYAAELEDARFSPAELVVQPKFVYPRLLLDAGISGRVTLQFIVDTLGQVEPSSIEIVTATHAAFAGAAREGILEARFIPAHYGGHSVRQLSKMPVSFKTQQTAATS
jgi:TonB family protein